MMKRKEVKGAPSTDLLVCFPTRSHLTFMPKTICSPSRTSNTRNHRHHNHHCGQYIGDGGLWSKTNHLGSELSEPTSPKVTCAGQIKAYPKSRSCKNWLSVMEEMERINIKKLERKKHNWGEVLGFKKESMQFLTCLRTFKFDLRCFGAFLNTNVSSDDDDDDDIHADDIENKDEKKLTGFGGYHKDPDDHEDISSRSAFSSWFMVLEDNPDCGLLGKQEIVNCGDNQDEVQATCVPPSNALLLMQCCSTPTKSLLEENEKQEEKEKEKEEEDDDEHKDENKRENLFEVMKYDCDFYKLSCDIAKETWVVGRTIKDSSRSQSSKRCYVKCLQEAKACLQ